MGGVGDEMTLAVERRFQPIQQVVDAIDQRSDLRRCVGRVDALGEIALADVTHLSG